MELTMNQKFVSAAVAAALAGYVALLCFAPAATTGVTTVSLATPHVATFLGVGLGLAAAIVAFVMACGGWVSAGVLMASLGLGAALAAAVAAVAGYIAYRYKKYGRANTVAW